MYTLRPATSDDYDFLFALNRATMANYVAQTWGTWDEDFQQVFFKNSFEPSKTHIVLAGGRGVGRLTVEIRPDAVYLAQIQIDPNFQGQGLGTRILRDVIADATDRGLPVELQVLKVNPARQLYERLGFERFEETVTHIQMRRPSA